MDATAILFAAFIFLMLLNVPIALCLGISAIVGIIVMNVPLSVVPMQIYAGIGKPTLLAIPFFILAGVIMDHSGISKRLIYLADTMVGHKTGGLAIVCVVVSCFFAAISGSGPATVAALGAVMIPAMIKSGYGTENSAALMSASGSIGIIIPPSIPFVVYSGISGVSVSRIFTAGIIPGILMGISLAIAAYIILKFNKQQVTSQEKASGKMRLNALKDAIWGLLMPVIILGGIYGGFFTPTEAAAVAAVYGLIVGLCIYRSIQIRDLIAILKESAIQSGGIMLIVGCAGLFAWLCQSEGITRAVSEAMASIATNQITFLILVTIIFLIAGFFLEATSAMYILVPIILPVANSLGYDLTALGVIISMNMAIGQITPPVGVNLYVACNIANITLKEISKKILPYCIALLIALLLVTFIPDIAMFLPNMIHAD